MGNRYYWIKNSLLFEPIEIYRFDSKMDYGLLFFVIEFDRR